MHLFRCWFHSLNTLTAHEVFLAVFLGIAPLESLVTFSSVTVLLKRDKGDSGFIDFLFKIESLLFLGSDEERRFSEVPQQVVVR